MRARGAADSHSEVVATACAFACFARSDFIASCPGVPLRSTSGFTLPPVSRVENLIGIIVFVAIFE